MPDNIVNTRIKLATKSDSDWSTLNPTLLSGEVGLDTTNKLIYVGDGTTAFNSLTAWNLLPTNHVTTDTAQNITGEKTFVGQKKIKFKQGSSSDKLGFTLYNSGGTEKGYLEYNPTNLIDGYPLMSIGNYASSASGITQVGFRRYSSVSGANGAYNLLMPLISDAKTPFDLTTTYTNFYLPLGFKNGNTMVTTAKSGVVDLGSLIPTPTVQVQSDWTQTDNTQVDYIKNKPTLATVATSGSYTDLSNKPMEIPTITTGDEGKVLTVNSAEDGVEWTDIPNELPTISIGDAGKALVVNSGETGVEWDTVSGLPPVTSANNGDTLEVVNGDWAVTDTLATTDDRLYNVEDMILNNRFFAPIATDAQTATLIVTDDDEAILSDWGLYVSGNDFVNVVNDNSTTNKISSAKIDWTDAPKELPDIESGDEGKVLTVNSTEDGVEWGTITGFLPLSGGTMTGTINFKDSSSVVGDSKFTIRDRIFGTCNILDMSTFVQGYITSNGEDGTDAGIIPYYIKSTWFGVSANTTYTFQSNIAEYGLHYFEYDGSFRFLRYAYTGQNLTNSISFTTGANTVYIRVQVNKFQNGIMQSINPSDITWAQVEKGSSASSYVPYALDNIELTKRRYVQDWSSKNLIDINTIQQGGINVSDTGTEFNSNIRIRTGSLKVTVGATYTISVKGVKLSGGCYYDSSNQWLSKIDDNGDSITFTVPSGAVTARFVMVNSSSSRSNVSPSDVTSIQLEKGLSATPFSPYALDNVELTKRVVPEFSASQNGKVLGVNSGKLAWVNNSGGGGTYYAGSGLALSDNTFRVDVPRVTESANHLPGISSFQLREYNGTSSNLPTAHWYHIYEAKGGDGNYGTQLALGMTTNQAYYRSYQNGWQSWRELTSNFSGASFVSGNRDYATHDANSMTVNGNYYYTSNGPSTALGMVSTDGALYAQFHTDSWGSQIAQDYRTGKLCVRGKNNGNWQSWQPVMVAGDSMQLTTSGDIFISPAEKRIRKINSSAGWSTQAYSNNGYVSNCYVSFKPNQANKAIMAGLDSNPSQDAGYSNIDYCWYFRQDGKADIYESGTSISLNRSYSAGNDFRIEYDGTLVNYYHNGYLVRSVSRAVGGTLYFDSCFYDTDCSIYDYDFGATTIATNTLTNAIKAVRGASVSTATSGCWTAMCNSDSTGSPVLPASSQWWHVLSLDWSGSDTSNWVSQLALPTQQNSSIYWRRNNSGGTSIDSSTWVKVLDANNYDSYAVPLYGGHMSGPLIVTATGAGVVGSYDEGIRINAGKNGYSTLLLGGTANTTTFTNDGSWWIGCNSQNISTLGRKLWIAHYGSTDSNTFFHVPNSSTVSPYLQLGSSGSVANGDYNAVNGNAVYSWLANNMSVAATGNRLVQRSAEGYIYGVYYNQSSNVEDNLFSASCNVMYSGSDNWVRKVGWSHIMSNYLFPVFTRGDGPNSVTSNDSRVIIDEGSYMVHKFGWASNATGVVTVTIRLHSTADTGTRIYFATLPKPAAPVGILPFSYNTGKVANAAWYYLSTDGRLSNTGAMYAGEPHCLTFSYVSATNEFA